jgi:hypothetical protein
MDEDLLSETAPERIAGLSDERLEELYNELSGLPDHPSNLIRVLRRRAQLLGEERARRETERRRQEQTERTQEARPGDTVEDERRHNQTMRWTKIVAALTAAGVLIAVIALCHTGSPPSSPAPNRNESTANPPPEYSAPVTPTQNPVSTPPLGIAHIAPSKMIAEVAAARPLQRSERGKQFAGLAVDWYLYFVDGRERGDEYFMVFSESRRGATVADGSVLKSEYPALQLTEKGTRMHVRAIVKYVTENVVVLEDITITISQ